jgi:hypothetical protein
MCNKIFGGYCGLSRSAFSVLVYGVYIFFLGVMFLLVPDLGLSILGMKTTSEVWILVAGWFVIWLGIYYIVSARSESKAFIRTTVYRRPTFLIFLGVLVAFGMVEPVIIVFRTVDLVTAIWTYWLFRLEKIDAA